MKIAVTGANGQLGSDIVSYLQDAGHEVIALTKEQLDISDVQAIERVMEEVKPEALVNTAAYHHVEHCENNPDMAKQINIDAPAKMSALAKKSGFRFIHISTDYVFDGIKNAPYIESDEAKPLNVYGKTKREGEVKLLEHNPDSIVMRVSAIYGHNPCRAKGGLNFIKLMLKLANERGQVAVVDDEFVSPTNTMNIAEQLAKILSTDVTGIVHATSEGQCSWYEFAREIFDYSGTQVVLNKANPADFPMKVPRPKYSVLENGRLKASGINVMKPWRESLHQYLDELKSEQSQTT